MAKGTSRSKRASQTEDDASALAAAPAAATETKAAARGRGKSTTQSAVISTSKPPSKTKASQDGVAASPKTGAARGKNSKGRKEASRSGLARASSGYKGVSRIDNPRKNSFGWYVRVTFRGTIYSKFFSDSLHDGKEAALQRAVEWRNETEKQLGKPRTDRVLMPRSTRNRSGVAGIQMWDDRYVVSWSPAPKELRRATFSIKKLGKEEAFARALVFRQQQELELYGEVLTQGDVAPPEEE